MINDLTEIKAAIRAGDKKQARELLRPILKNPTAETWFVAAQACESREKAVDCLRRALACDPTYERAGRALAKLESGGLDMPSLDVLVDIPPSEEPSLPQAEFAPYRLNRNKDKRSGWTTVGCAGSILLSLSSAYFVLTVLGSPLAEQVRAVVDRFTGEGGAQPSEGTPIFGRPSEGIGGGSAAGENSEADGEAGGNTSSGGENSGSEAIGQPTEGFVVRPNKSVEIKRQQPVSDVLDAGYAHEYTFDVLQGEEIAIGVQFFSPSAKKVGANVAVLDPDGYNAESYCQRDTILSDGSSVAFICQAYRSGTWKLHLFGRSGESTGVYVVTYDRM